MTTLLSHKTKNGLLCLAKQNDQKKKHYETQPQDNEHKCNEAKMCLLHPLFLTIEGWIKEIYIFQLKMFGSAHGVFPF